MAVPGGGGLPPLTWTLLPLARVRRSFLIGPVHCMGGCLCRKILSIFGGRLVYELLLHRSVSLLHRAIRDDETVCEPTTFANIKWNYETVYAEHQRTTAKLASKFSFRKLWFFREAPTSVHAPVQRALSQFRVAERVAPEFLAPPHHAPSAHSQFPQLYQVSVP